MINCKIHYYICSICFLICSFKCHSIESKPFDFNCSQEELMRAFPYEIVKRVLVDANYKNEQSEAIAKQLSAKDSNIAKMVEDRAAKLHPNPFKDLTLRDQALKIYQETLYDVFSGILKSNHIDDETEILRLLETIRSIKSKMLIDCLKTSNS